MTINERVSEQRITCAECNAIAERSMDFCLQHKCPYYLVKEYTDADRAYVKQIQKL